MLLHTSKRVCWNMGHAMTCKLCSSDTPEESESEESGSEESDDEESESEASAAHNRNSQVQRGRSDMSKRVCWNKGHP